ncbi:MAG TPA: cytochrome c oxidase subunit II [Chitinophagaceae bacterium]|nr:cytochrome c oxidase subunit II [Chitinophagaceae bacterium]MCB9054887.1 cytochrome c oxidase subunit II [Chitinophagales bacterium]HPG12045.1 cytochrome c oxidase subunit II [Chitinophagaceae bacterium]HRX94042.1 cytochrome c oxidase subunit II [Chitinophagaceae bacterium]
MQTFFIVAILVLGFLITFQIAKASEYVAVLRGIEKARKQTNKINGFMLLSFLILGLIGVWYCNKKLSGKILGAPASDHGVLVDRMLYVTLAITFIVFIITQIALFWFAYKYQESDKRKAFYYPHNNKLELIWTVIPAITLTVLVGFGIFYWFKITGNAPKNSMVVEVVGSQFKWEFRYPGTDGVLGKKYFKKINDAESNPLGQLWEDPANHDDIYVSGESMHLVVNKPVHLVIGSKDVIHDVGLAHFRMKMDAVPGTPTSMWFTPTKTTKQMIEETGNPDFVYEISCDQMCGKGHWSMRGTIVVETQEEFDAWMVAKKPQYLVANPSMDPANKTDSVTTVAAVVQQ